ncbi:MAG: penicillin-binding protein activator, partial [Gammaproteobacteria bacterium]
MSDGLSSVEPHSVHEQAGDRAFPLLSALARGSRGLVIDCLVAAALVCAGCGPATTKPAKGVDPAIRANQLLEEGEHKLAAEEFLRLAGLYPKDAVHYHLRSAEAYIDAGDSESAGRVLAETDARDRNDKVYEVLLRARLALLDGNAPEALSLTAALAEQTPVSLQALRHSIRADAYQDTGDRTAAVRERVLLGRHQTDERARQENAQQLWTNLRAVGQEDLLLLTGSNEADLGGWAELALMNRSLGTRPDMLRQSLASWIESHPGHPSIPIVTDQILADSQRYQSSPTHIALLLPFSGQYAEAARAIRDGFISAWFGEIGFRPRVVIYDANAINIVEQYQSAVNAGADMVVGPLEKSAIGALL